MRIDKAREALEKDLALYKLQQERVDMVLAVINKLKHHKNVTKKLETQLRKDFPQYGWSYDVTYGQYHLGCWGKGIDFDQRVYFVISDNRVEEKGWEAFIDEAKRCSTHDYQAMVERDIKALDKLQTLQSQFEKLRDKARGLFPEGESETLRGESPSYKLKEYYPEILGTDDNYRYES